LKLTPYSRLWILIDSLCNQRVHSVTAADSISQWNLTAMTPSAQTIVRIDCTFYVMQDDFVFDLFSRGDIDRDPHQSCSIESGLRIESRILSSKREILQGCEFGNGLIVRAYDAGDKDWYVEPGKLCEEELQHRRAGSALRSSAQSQGSGSASFLHSSCRSWLGINGSLTLY
jgi:hypothetical protein